MAKKIAMKDRVPKKPTLIHQFSINSGDRMKIAGTNYAGRNPVYNQDEFGVMVKVQNGVPYVNLDKLDLS